MKKNLLIGGVVLIVVIAIITFIYMDYFIIGDLRSEGLYINNISVSDNLITINGGTGGSAEAYKGFEYYIVNSSLYIEVEYVLVSDAYRYGNFEINIEDDFSSINKIYFTDGNNDKLIWSK